MALTLGNLRGKLYETRRPASGSGHQHDSPQLVSRIPDTQLAYNIAMGQEVVKNNRQAESTCSHDVLSNSPTFPQYHALFARCGPLPCDLPRCFIKGRPGQQSHIFDE